MKFLYRVMLLTTAVCLAVAGGVWHTNTAMAQVTPVDFSDFTGTGLTPNATTTGSLDSNIWSVTGLADGDCNFGDTCTTGDLALGTNIGSTTQGGLYAFIDVGVSGNTRVVPN